MSQRSVQRSHLTLRSWNTISIAFIVVRFDTVPCRPVRHEMLARRNRTYFYPAGQQKARAMWPVRGDTQISRLTSDETRMIPVQWDIKKMTGNSLRRPINDIYVCVVERRPKISVDRCVRRGEEAKINIGLRVTVFRRTDYDRGQQHPQQRRSTGWRNALTSIDTERPPCCTQTAHGQYGPHANR